MNGAALAAIGFGALQGLAQRSQDLFNASAAQQDAQNILAANQTNQFLRARSQRERVQAIRSAFGASGLALSGTPAALLADQIGSDVMNNAVASYEARLRAFRSQRIADEFQRKANRDVLLGIIGGASRATPFL